jgi:hypothetical protein
MFYYSWGPLSSKKSAQAAQRRRRGARRPYRACRECWKRAGDLCFGVSCGAEGFGCPVDGMEFIFLCAWVTLLPRFTHMKAYLC